ncbi:MAG: phenylalanine--tRNA ligase subunit alpha [Elusimicrobia bacterium RIFOXYD2_FULL_34_15]|nr:MAG: phenylalanine--tRNA ligase subunit alpha [Elusimicrobia bacterium RIFOXYD2_FULL_34_15]
MKEMEKESFKEISEARTQEELERIRLKYLGRKGIITENLSQISELPLEERKLQGKKINDIKQHIAEEIEKRKSDLKEKSISGTSESKIDITLPGKPFEIGKIHPLMQLMNEVKDIFLGLGFTIATGPDMESDYYNFTALNIPKDHPSRDIQDTFYIKPKEQNAKSESYSTVTKQGEKEIVLRTHTSPVQIHIMEKNKPPIRIIAPGRVYRHEAVDASHSYIFHQIEGLAVDEDITFADLKAVLDSFIKKMFGSNVLSRFRPSYFPFTEPSAEVDMQCLICKGTGCSVCKQTGWVELLGCGMVNPKVFEFVNYDSNKYTGYAFGMGIERIAMLKYGINDMRLFYENDLDFLKQF